MKVKDLIKQLQECDPESEVICQKDGEGNGYSPLSGIDNEAIYIPENTWSGIVYSAKWTADECCLEEDEWKQLKKKPRAVILYPVN